MGCTKRYINKFFNSGETVRMYSCRFGLNIRTLYLAAFLHLFVSFSPRKSLDLIHVVICVSSLKSTESALSSSDLFCVL